MLATARMRKDGEYVQKQYREKFLKIYIENFLMRMKEVLDNHVITDNFCVGIAKDHGQVISKYSHHQAFSGIPAPCPQDRKQCGNDG